MEVYPSCFANFTNLLKPLAGGKLCLSLEVSLLFYRDNSFMLSGMFKLYWIIYCEDNRIDNETVVVSLLSWINKCIWVNYWCYFFEIKYVFIVL